MYSAIRGLEEHRKLEAALDDLKSELKTSNASKETYKTLKEENELIMRWAVGVHVYIPRPV